MSEFAADPNERQPHIKTVQLKPFAAWRGRRLWFLLIVASLLMGAVAFSQFLPTRPRMPADLPLIVAATEPYKVKPENPGGEQVPFQDSTVFQVFERDGSTKTVERLLPSAELLDEKNLEPAPAAQEDKAAEDKATQDKATQDKSEPQQPPVNSVAMAPIIEAPKVEATVAPVAKPEKAPEKLAEKSAEKPAQKTTDKSLDAPREKLADKAPATKIADKTIAAIIAQNADPELDVPDTVVADNTAKAASASASASAGDSRVQLASATDEKRAKAEAARLQKSLSKFLSGIKLGVVAADLGARGVFYRIQSQPISEDTAQELCESLKAQKQGCIIVR